jgi:hypothetical protein
MSKSIDFLVGYLPKNIAGIGLKCSSFAMVNNDYFSSCCRASGMLDLPVLLQLCMLNAGFVVV